MLRWTYYAAREEAGMWRTWVKILTTQLGLRWALLAKREIERTAPKRFVNEICEKEMDSTGLEQVLRRYFL